MSAPFQPGDCVLCVDDSPSPAHPAVKNHSTGLRAGSVHRIESCFLGGATGFAYIRLVGYPHSSARSGCRAYRFRKIDEDVTESFREQMRSLGKQRADAE